MQGHLDQTLTEAAHELQGQYATSVADYETIREHILEMADLLSSGIMRQFPKRFRRREFRAGGPVSRAEECTSTGTLSRPSP
jgi:hypothetical protein